MTPAFPTEKAILPAQEASKPNFAFRLMPAFSDVVFLMPIVFLFARMNGVKTLLADGDTGWHIRTGEWILSHHQVPLRDTFSFTKPGAPWYAWEWLCDVLFAFLNRHGGLATLLVFSVLLISVTFVLLYRLARRHANPVVAAVITMVAAAASAIHWLARPHLFSLLFLVLFYCALENVREGRERCRGVPWLAILPFVTIVWTNLHGGFLIGIVMVAAYGVGEGAQWLLAARRTPQALRRARNYLLSAAACAAASLVNPYFYRLHVHMAEFLGSKFQSEHIVEYQTLSFHNPTALFFEILLILGASAAMWCALRGSYIEAVLVFLWAHAALLAGRNIPIFVIVAAPIVASAVDAWLQKLPELQVSEYVRAASRQVGETLAEIAKTDAIPRWHLASAAGIAVVAALLFAAAPPPRFRPYYDPESYPAKAIALLKADPSARVFTIDDWGDYLIYRLYPSNRVFVDGRFDFYGDDFMKKYFDITSVKPDWQRTLSHYGVNTILLPPSAPLAGALKESRHWRVVYDDGVALIFEPAGTAATPRPEAASGAAEPASHGKTANAASAAGSPRKALPI